MHLRPRSAAALLAMLAAPAAAWAQTVTVDTSAGGRAQLIDGFGTCLYADDAANDWFRRVYYDDLGSSILRIDITPAFVSPYSDNRYNSPWFGQTPSIDNGGPEGNYVRTYTGAADYTRSFGGAQAQIAVMGPDIDANVALFDFEAHRVAGEMAQLGQARRAELGGFTLYGSMWSPAPWLKLTSGNTIGNGGWPLPAAGTAWPFVWGGNFAGGLLDTSETPLAQFNDGTGPTSALTQFARSLAAWLRGFQNAYGVRFNAISIQNEVNFEEFYNSCSYPLSSQYIKALKAARAELDKYPDLRDILIAGPEDLLGGDPYGLWQYGGGADVTHKNLQYLQHIDADPAAKSALGFFAIHGYDRDGVSSAGADSRLWDWWVNGWSASPAAGLPATVRGFGSYGKKSWMTETSGERPVWLEPASGFPSNGGWSIALKIHQALTTGNESAWIYWQTSDGSAVNDQTLTDSTLLADSPKLAAARHYFRHVRPGAQRVEAAVSGSTTLFATAFLHEAAGTLTLVLINASASSTTATVSVPALPAGIASFSTWTSSDGSYWNAGSVSASGGQASVPVPGWGVVTLVSSGGAVVPGPDAGVPLGDAGGASPDAAPAAADASAPGSDASGATGPDASGPIAPDAGRADAAQGPVPPAGDAGALPEAPEISGACGCSSSGAGSWAGLFGLALALAWRRR